MHDTTVASSLLNDCYALLSKTKSNVVWEILRQSETFTEWNHYPKGDVFDHDTHSQYFYHAHPPDLGKRWPEHGHFHLFMRKKGIPESIAPTPLLPFQQEGKNDDLCHLIAVSMDKFGKPMRLFTTNRWVTGETWYSAAAIEQFIDQFAITHAWPSWPTNIWITQLVQDYREQILTLLRERELTVERWQAAHPEVNAYEDRKLEVTSLLDL